MWRVCLLQVGAVDVLVSPESGPTAAFLEVLPFLSLSILTLCCFSLFCSLFKLAFQSFTESVDSTYGCLLAGGRVVVATANWWELFLFSFYQIDKKNRCGHETQVVDAKQLLFSPIFALPSCYKQPQLIPPSQQPWVPCDNGHLPMVTGGVSIQMNFASSPCLFGQNQGARNNIYIYDIIDNIYDINMMIYISSY